MKASQWSIADHYFMGMALRLAEQGQGIVSPNPKVGAVIVKNNRIIGCGYHPRAGDPHAEIFALQMAGSRAKNATLYITLEPCCHFGKTPPCTSTIIKSGIKKIIIAAYDPNPLVNGKGVHALEHAGLDVAYGLQEKEAQLLNKEFFTFIREKRPFIRMKFAMTLDGKIASSSGRSQWLSSEDTRSFTNRLRAMSDALLVGVNTILHDNPHLTIRTGETKSKILQRIILDSSLQTSPAALLFDSRQPVIIFAAADDLKNHPKKYPSHCEVIKVSSSAQQLNLSEILSILHRRNINSILVEGGAKIISSFLEKNLADEIFAVITPSIMGGSHAMSFVQFLEERPLYSMIPLYNPKTIMIHNDIILHYSLAEGKRINHQN